MIEEIMTDPEIRIATEDIECNACLHIVDCLSDVIDHCSPEQIDAIEKARENDWKIKAGEEYVYYIWNPSGSEECKCCEIPAIREICNEQDLWCN